MYSLIGGCFLLKYEMTDSFGFFHVKGIEAKRHKNKFIKTPETKGFYQKH
jgi:hypothetical protein